MACSGNGGFSQLGSSTTCHNMLRVCKGNPWFGKRLYGHSGSPQSFTLCSEIPIQQYGSQKKNIYIYILQSLYNPVTPNLQALTSELGPRLSLRVNSELLMPKHFEKSCWLRCASCCSYWLWFSSLPLAHTHTHLFSFF